MMTSVCLCWSRFSDSSCTKVVSFVSVECLALKPLAVCQSSGIVELDNDLLKMKVRTGAISDAKSISMLGSMVSGPAALYGFIFSSNCSTPGTVIFCICGYGLSPISGKGSVVIGLKADLN